MSMLFARLLALIALIGLPFGSSSASFKHTEDALEYIRNNPDGANVPAAMRRILQGTLPKQLPDAWASERVQDGPKKGEFDIAQVTENLPQWAQRAFSSASDGDAGPY